MQIIIDADACPVVDIALRIAKEKDLPCIIVCDNSHFIEREGASTIVVDKGAESADIRIANTISQGDVVITQDYGLAALVLGKKAKALNQNGLIFTNENIENLLYSRFISKKARMSGLRTKGPQKRTADMDAAFIEAFSRILEEK